MTYRESNKIEGSVTDQTTLARILSDELTLARIKNPSYSLRALARKLKLPASALSEVMSGKRRVSRKAAEKIADRLLLDPEKRNEVLSSIPATRKRRASQIEAQPADLKSVQITMDHFRSISEWYHFGILSLAETRGFKSDAQWIANRLGLSKATVQQAIERLLRLQMLRRDEHGELKVTGESYSSPDGTADISLRKGHAANLELARKSLENDPVSIRDFTAITMAIDPAKLPEAKKMIRIFRDQLCAHLNSGETTEVYKFCMQMIPLTHSEEV